MMHQVLAAPGKTTRRKKNKTSAPAVGSPIVLEAVSPESVAALNAFYRRRQPVEMMVGGATFSVEAAWPLPERPATSTSVIAFMLDDIAGELHLPRALLERWLLDMDPEREMARVAPEHAALLMESLLGGELEWLEEKLRCRIELTAIDGAPTAVDGTSVAFGLGAEERFGKLVLANPGRFAELGGLLDQAAPRPAEWQPAFPVPVRICRGAVTVGVGDLRTLSPGDVVLLDDVDGDAAGALITVADRLVAPVQLDGGKGRLLAPPKYLNGSRWEWIMGPKTDQAQAPDDAGMDDLPVSLVFELGRSVLSLGELKRLNPGAVVTLPDVTSETVDVVANGKRVGRGEIVRIGESLGVRVVRMFDNA